MKYCKFSKYANTNSPNIQIQILQIYKYNNSHSQYWAMCIHLRISKWKLRKTIVILPVRSSREWVMKSADRIGKKSKIGLFRSRRVCGCFMVGCYRFPMGIIVHFWGKHLILKNQLLGISVSLLSKSCTLVVSSFCVLYSRRNTCTIPMDLYFVFCVCILFLPLFWWCFVSIVITCTIPMDASLNREESPWQNCPNEKKWKIKTSNYLFFTKYHSKTIIQRALR